MTSCIKRARVIIARGCKNFSLSLPPFFFIFTLFSSLSKYLENYHAAFLYPSLLDFICIPRLSENNPFSNDIIINIIINIFHIKWTLILPNWIYFIYELFSILESRNRIIFSELLENDIRVSITKIVSRHADEETKFRAARVHSSRTSPSMKRLKTKVCHGQGQQQTWKDFLEPYNNRDLLIPRFLSIYRIILSRDRNRPIEAFPRTFG